MITRVRGKQQEPFNLRNHSPKSLFAGQVFQTVRPNYILQERNPTSKLPINEDPEQPLQANNDHNEDPQI